MTTGPSRADLRFRVLFGVVGLCFTAFVLFSRGVPGGMAFIEVGLFPLVFFGWTMVSAARRLLRTPGGQD